jgi:hypothetical protein
LPDEPKKGCCEWYIGMPNYFKRFAEHLQHALVKLQPANSELLL